MRRAARRSWLHVTSTVASAAVVAAACTAAVVAPTAADARPTSVRPRVVTSSGLVLAAPATARVGERITVTFAAPGQRSTAAFEAMLRFDHRAVEVVRSTVASTLPGATGTRSQAISAVETPDRHLLAAWSCTGHACAHSRTRPNRAATLATVELQTLRSGRITLRLDGIVLTDARGRVLRNTPRSIDVSIRVGSSKHLVRAPQTSTRAANSSTGSTDVDHDGATTALDVTAALPSYLARIDGDRACRVRHSGDCTTIVDLQRIAGAAQSVPTSPRVRTATTAHRFAGPSSPSIVFTVNSTNDAADARFDGICQTAVPGECTLRAAIQEANRAAGPSLVAFNIPGGGIQTIRPNATMPILNNQLYPITIDGFTQPESSPNTDPLVSNAVHTIELVGKGPSSIDGFFIASPNNTIRGLNMHGFNRSVWIYGINANGNTIVGNTIGLTTTGGYDPTTALYRSSSCVILQGSPGGASDNHIGAPGAANRNVISGCNHQGIATYNIGTNNNFFQNNIIGLDPTGTLRRGMQSHGIDINTGSANNQVGGTGWQEGNIISGNFQTGVEISHNPYTLYNKVIGNRIGSDPTGTTFGTYTENGQWGVHLEGFPNCNNAPCPEDAGFNVVTDNVIVNSGQGGVMIDKGVHDSVVANNRIGVTSTDAEAPNTFFGVNLQAGAVRNTIGPGNIIAGNENGVQIQPDGLAPPNSASSVTSFNRITQNSIFHNGSNGAASLGIDLAPLGVVNTALNADPYSNEAMLPPTLSNAKPATIDATTCVGCTVELFTADRPAGSFGSGARYLSSAVADVSGVATLFVPVGVQGLAVTATATNTAGSTSEFSRNVLIPVPRPTNAAPTAAFSTNCIHLTCTYDATASADSDGHLVRWQWNFGDGATGEGQTAVHTFATGGSWNVGLTVTDNDTATGTATDTTNAVNLPPVAAFSTACIYQRCAFDGTGSTDPDGTVATWSWNFGDGTTGTGASTFHSFPTSGTYTVTLAVDDGTGGTNTTSQSVTVVALPVGTVAYDSFLRSQSGGWGTAELGGPWTTNAPAADWSVGGAQGRVSLTNAATSHAGYLAAIPARDTDTIVDVATNKIPAGGSYGQAMYLTARRVAANTEYRARVRFLVGNTIRVGVVKVAGSSTEVAVGSEVLVPGLTFSAGQNYSMRFRVVGANPTTLQVKVWTAGTAEPPAWNVNVTDSQPELQTFGANGVRTYLGSGATNGPVSYSFDNYDYILINTPAVVQFASNCTKSACTFDASAASAPNGSIVSYAWDFGDGATATGLTTSHDYGPDGFGPHPVTLTIVDSLGTPASNTKTVTPVNLAPVPSFTMHCSHSTCSFDAAASTDPDGTIVGYQWDLGDGTTSTETSLSHTFVNSDVYTIVLQVTDDNGSTVATSQTVALPIANQLPLASFTSNCTFLGCSFDASGSTDPDGSVAAVAWDFGDGSGGTGSTSSHTYALSGTWPVTVAVTDDGGGTSTFTQTVSVTIPPPGPSTYAVDSFSRSVTNGWGAAETGGSWTVTSNPINTAVTGGVATQRLASPGAGVLEYLNGVSASDTDLRVRVAADKTPIGFGHWSLVTLRKAATNYEYRVRLRFAPTGVFLSATRLAGTSTSTVIVAEANTGVPAVANQFVQVRAQAVGVNPTTIRAKVWRDGQPEPATWALTVTDSTSGLQTVGGIGLLSSNSTSGLPSVTMSYDDLSAVATNTPPTAAFSSSCTTMACNFDASASSDPNGTIAQTDWVFGDGSTASGPIASHTFAKPGTYAVTVTVTDDFGAKAVTSQNVFVNTPPVAAVTASCDSFPCTVDATGSAEPDAGDRIVSYLLDFGDGTTATTPTASHIYFLSGTYTITATVTDSFGATNSATTSVTVNRAPTAAASASCSVLACNFDASGSADPDGMIVQTAWDFSDGATGTGTATSHTFATAGTYPVRVTVTDNMGATATALRTVTVAPTIPSSVYAQDTFTRTVNKAWGTADQGGPWTNVGTTSAFGVNGNTATLTFTAAVQSYASRLNSVSGTDFDVQSKVSYTQNPIGSAWFGLIPRSIASNTEYRVRVRFGSTTVFVAPYRLVSGVQTAISPEITVPGLTPSVGAVYRTRTNISGTNPTRIRMKIWLDGTAEPGTWLIDVTDSTAQLQAAGTTGVIGYGGNLPTYPFVYNVDDYTVRAANTPPTASFTATCGGSNACDFDASGSSDADDGSIALQVWSFGDGAITTGATTSHTYGAPGTYIATLTVYDNQGAIAVTTRTVTVT